MSLSESCGGYCGAVLQVDLSRGKWAKRPLSGKLARSFIGGRGFTTKMQWDALAPRTDPLSPENILVFAAGPLVGTGVPLAARFTVGGKSPLTGILGDSNCGGQWGPELKFSGYDMVVVRGRSKSPVYLWIDNDKIEIKNADAVWGKNTFETDTIIKEEVGDEDIEVAMIGQAGENQVKYACIMAHMYNAAGRTGMGCVMGSKNLKAIAVRGSKGVSICNVKKFMKLVDQFNEILRNDTMSSKVAPKLGTPMWVESAVAAGSVATRNYSAAGFTEGWEKISGDALRDKYVSRIIGCFGCRICCHRYSVIKDGEFGSTCAATPEYFCLSTFGFQCGNNNLESIIKANQLCNLYGLDIASGGAVIAFAMECYEKGLITKKDTGGLGLEWGNYRSIVELVERIALRKGIGDLLAEGSRRAAERIGKGAEKYAMQIKGMEIPETDPRARKAYAYRYCLATRGGDHLRAPNARFNLGQQIPFEEVGQMHKYSEDYKALIDSLGVCHFVIETYFDGSDKGFDLRQKALIDFYSAVTGLDADLESLMKVGERVYNLEKAFNVREGLTRADDVFPERFLKEPMPFGPHKGNVEDYYPRISENYYKARGWNIETSIPTRKKLMELELEDVATELEKARENR
jgi:aldehyde:ferredoxin oxidoreductase